jgi:6-phosphogluconolactonase (cycloisomerase 2 family)
MRTRFPWIFGVAALISIGLLAACSTKYSSSDNGLVVVSTQGTPAMDTFSLNLGNGHITQIYNADAPPPSGLPTSVVLAPGGAYAYVLITESADIIGSVTGVATYQVASDGKLAQVGTPTALAPEVITLPGNPSTTENVPAVPSFMAIDSAGQFLFVADSSTADSSQNKVPGAVSVFSIGSSGSLTEVANSPFVLPVGGVNPVSPGPCSPLEPCSSASAVAVSPTIYPPAYAACSESIPPTTEHLYVTDSISYVVLNYSVASSGALQLVPLSLTVAGIATGTTPSGVAVDPCNRFVYVSNGPPSNSVSAYTICSVVSLPTCTQPDFHLIQVGSPFVAGLGPGPLLVDPFAQFLYVLDQQQNAISAYKISTSTGGLSPLSTPTVATNSFPTSMAIRSDDSWMFVANLSQGTVSQYAITPATGTLTPQPAFQTDNYPWGVAVK